MQKLNNGLLAQKGIALLKTVGLNMNGKEIRQKNLILTRLDAKLQPIVKLSSLVSIGILINEYGRTLDSSSQKNK